MFYSDKAEWLQAISTKVSSADLDAVEASSALVLPDVTAEVADTVALIKAEPVTAERDKIKLRLAKLVARYDAVRFEPEHLAQTIAELKTIHSRYTALGLDPQWGAVLKNLFTNRRGSPLCLTAPDAVALLTWVADVVQWTHAVAGQQLPLAQWYAKLLSEVGTHNVKNVDVSLACVSTFPGNDLHLGYLNSRAIREEYAGNSTGGYLRKAFWLVLILPFRVTAFGQTFSIRSLLTTPHLRELVRNHGVSALDPIPVIVPDTGPGVRSLPPAKFALSATESVEFHMTASNAMLRATKALATSLSLRAKEAQAQAGASLRAALLEKFAAQPEVVGAIQTLNDAVLGDCSNPRNTALRAKTVKLLGAAAAKAIKALPPASRYTVDTAALADMLNAGKVPAPPNYSFVPTVATNEQLAGKAYQDYAGSLGLVRFHNTKYTPPRDSQVVRQFYGLPASIARWLQKTLAFQERRAVPADPYRLGTSWLPLRTQRQLADAQLKKLAALWAAKLAEVREPYANFPDAHLLTPRTDIQHWALAGAQVPPDTLFDLAAEGFVLMGSSSASSKEQFVATVLAQLKSAPVK